MLIMYFSLIILSIFLVYTNSDNSVNLKVLNQLEDSIQVFWINTFSEERNLVSQTTTPMRQSSEAKIVTFPGHEFSVRLLHHIPGLDVNFTVSDHDETIYVYRDPDSGELYIERRDAMTDFLDYLHVVMGNCNDQFSSYDERADRLLCIKRGIFDEMLRVQTSTGLVDTFRSDMAKRLTNYMCQDEELESTEPTSRYDFHYENRTYTVNVYFDSPTAKIWSVEDMITSEDCEILAQKGFPTLESAATTDDQGENIMTEERVAEQGHYLFDNNTLETDELWKLYQRGIALVNRHAGLNLNPEGQEGITIVRYGVGGEYRPHCDGDCDGKPALEFGRVATGIYYCETAKKGGATAFPKANIFIRPKKHMAVYFSYVSPEGILDSGLTEHAGCPVLEGQKWIATTWLRNGVSQEESCNGYDPTGIMYLDDQIGRARESLEAKGYRENDVEEYSQLVKTGELETPHEEL